MYREDVVKIQLMQRLLWTKTNQLLIIQKHLISSNALMKERPVLLVTYKTSNVVLGNENYSVTKEPNGNQKTISRRNIDNTVIRR